MAIKREITTSEAFINNVNEKFSTNLTNKATPLELLRAFKKVDENANYEITDDEVLELINDGEPGGGLQPVEGLQYIYVNSYPTKREYQVGDMFDPTGLVVVGRFADNTTRELIPNKEYMLGTSETDLHEVSSTSIVLQEKDINLKAFAMYDDNAYTQTEDFSLFMLDEDGHPFIKGLTIIQNTAKTQYVLNEEYNLSGLIINIVYSDGSGGPVSYDNDLDNFNYNFNYDLPTLDTEGTFNLEIKLNAGIPNPAGALPVYEPYSVYATKPEPEFNYYLYNAPYHRVFAGQSYQSHSYDLNNDVIGGSIKKVMTDGTMEDIPFSTEYLNCSLQGHMLTDNQTEYVMLYDLEGRSVGNYEVTYYEDAIISNINTYEIGPQKYVGANATLDDVAIYVTIAHNIYGTEVTVVPIPEYVTLNINNPLVLGDNEYTITYNDADSGLTGTSDTAIITAYEPQI